MTEPVGTLVDNLFRREAGRIVARLLHRFGPQYLQLAEDLAQEALLRALHTWPFSGVPQNPVAWLHAVADRLAIDAIRRDAMLRRVRPDVEVALAQEGRTSPTEPVDATELGDDELQLLFMCAHPALTQDMRVPLMLNIACGFSAAEIAHGLRREVAAVAQTLVRAKQRLRTQTGLADLSAPEELPQRLAPVLDALHLMFSEGYEATAGETLVRAEICAEALRLAGVLSAHGTASSPQVHALAALFCFHAARLESRVDAASELVPLADQDRSRWDRALIVRGFQHLDAAASGESLTEHHVLAAIAAQHIQAADFAGTDWRALQDWYDLLVAVAPTPVHRLNRSVVVAETTGPASALAELDALASEPSVARFHLFHATRAEMLRRLGRHAEAVAALDEALALAISAPARRLLQRRLRDFGVSLLAAER